MDKILVLYLRQLLQATSSAMSEDKLDQGLLFGSQELRHPFAVNVGILDYIRILFELTKKKKS